MSKTALNAHLWDRSDDEWYQEPGDCTSALLTVERFEGRILDPACGAGNVVKACLAAGLDAIGSDVRLRVQPRPDWFVGLFDYINDQAVPVASNVVTNPPFFKAKGTEAFIRTALSLPETHKLCIFTDVKFLAGGKRAAGLYREHKPSRVWMLSPRPSCPPGAYLEAGNVAGGGTADFCWIVWDRSAPEGPTEFGWLIRNAIAEREIAA